MADTRGQRPTGTVRHDRETEASEGDVVEQLTPSDGETVDEEVVQREDRVDTHEGLVNEADLIEQSEPVGDDDEDYPYGGPG